MSKIMQILRQNADAEYEAFKKAELARSKEEIFDDNYRIRFYDEMHGYLTAEGADANLNAGTARKMAKRGTSLISLLYDYFLKREYASINTWEDITDMINNYFEGGTA